MQYLGISFDVKHPPKLDQSFIPFGVWSTAYGKDAKMPIAIAVERNEGNISVRRTCIHGTEEMAAADYRYVERFVKFLLWSIGGFRVYICGCSDIAKKLQKAYTPAGERAFDYDFFQKLYEQPLQILDLPLDACPAANEEPNLFVSVNGYNCLLPKGKTSLVPKSVAAEIRRARKAQQKLDETVDALKERG